MVRTTTFVFRLHMILDLWVTVSGSSIGNFWKWNKLNIMQGWSPSLFIWLALWQFHLTTSLCLWVLYDIHSALLYFLGNFIGFPMSFWHLEIFILYFGYFFFTQLIAETRHRALIKNIHVFPLHLKEFNSYDWFGSLWISVVIIYLT